MTKGKLLREIKHWRIGLLGLGVSVLAVYFVIAQMDVRQLGVALQSARYIYVLPSGALLFIGLWTRAIRWRILLDQGLPLERAFSIMNVAYLVNGILPLRMGEIARAFLATRATPPVPVFKSLSTIIVERLLDVLAVMGLVALALLAGSVPDQLRVAASVLAPAALLGFIFLIVLASQRALAQRLMDSLTARLGLLQRLRLSAWFSHFLDGLAPLTRPSALLGALVWTAISWAFSAAAGYILMLAFFDRADWAATCLFIAAASLAIAVPAVPGNIGTYELSILLALGAMGYGESTSTATAFALVVHGLNLSVYALAGVIGFVREGISLEQLSQGVQRIQQPTESRT